MGLAVCEQNGKTGKTLQMVGRCWKMLEDASERRIRNSSGFILCSEGVANS